MPLFLQPRLRDFSLDVEFWIDVALFLLSVLYAVAPLSLASTLLMGRFCPDVMVLGMWWVHVLKLLSGFDLHS